MRTLFAAFLLCLFVGITTADRVVCPDGCTDEAPAQTASLYASAPCAFCLGWSHSSIVVADRPAPRVVAGLVPTSLTPATPPLPTLELPPKAA